MSYYSPLTTHHSPLTTHHSPLTTHHSPLTTHHHPKLVIHDNVGAAGQRQDADDFAGAEVRRDVDGARQRQGLPGPDELLHCGLDREPRQREMSGEALAADHRAAQRDAPRQPVTREVSAAQGLYLAGGAVGE